jgi:hypothetical protein
MWTRFFPLRQYACTRHPNRYMLSCCTLACVICTRSLVRDLHTYFAKRRFAFWIHFVQLSSVGLTRWMVQQSLLTTCLESRQGLIIIPSLVLCLTNTISSGSTKVSKQANKQANADQVKEACTSTQNADNEHLLATHLLPWLEPR